MGHLPLPCRPAVGEAGVQRVGKCEHGHGPAVASMQVRVGAALQHSGEHGYTAISSPHTWATANRAEPADSFASTDSAANKMQLIHTITISTASQASSG